MAGLLQTRRNPLAQIAQHGPQVGVGHRPARLNEDAAHAEFEHDHLRRGILRDARVIYQQLVNQVVVMIATALGIHAARSSEAVEDLQTMMLSILGGGLLSLFLLGFLTLRVDSHAACIATVLTVLSVAAWLLMDTPSARAALPGVSNLLPDKFWVGVFANLLLFSVGYGVSLFLGNRREKSLQGLTVWSTARKNTDIKKPCIGPPAASTRTAR